MTSVPGSAASQPMMSPTVTSASLPVVTRMGVPMPRLRAVPKTWVPYAPLWLAMPMRPGRGHPASNELEKMG